MPHTRKELLSWAKGAWEKIKGKQQEEVTIKGWVARDRSGDLFIYTVKPHRENVEWNAYSFKCSCVALPSIYFPSVTWKDDKPTPCEITIKLKQE